MTTVSAAAGAEDAAESPGSEFPEHWVRHATVASAASARPIRAPAPAACVFTERM
ncbi:hypothetical protein MINS_00410 [Mycolicibacterium insubricum]|nr:hypothetical protein MINS_00410 [Mycolicibacterium insubricum]